MQGSGHHLQNQKEFTTKWHRTLKCQLVTYLPKTIHFEEFKGCGVWGTILRPGLL